MDALRDAFRNIESRQRHNEDEIRALKNRLATISRGSQLVVSTTSASHGLLSATHIDTVPAGVVRGDLIVGNSTPKWARLAKGTAGSLFYGDGTDSAWTINPKIAGYARVGSASAPANITAGDFTATRVQIGANTAFGSLSAGGGANLSGNAYLASTLTDTTSGAKASMMVEVTLNPASNSSAEFRALNFTLITGSATGITLATIEAGFFEIRHRQDGAITTEADGLVVRPYVIDASSPATVGTPAVVRGVYVRRYQRPAGTSTGTITDFRGLEFSSDGGSFITVGTQRDIFIRNPAASTTITAHVGIDIESLSRATTNFGIRNASNLVQTGYARFGAVTAPTNVTDGDVNLVRLFAGDDAAFVVGDTIRLNRASYVPTNADEYNFNETLILAPGGTAGTNNRIGYRLQMLVRPTAADGNRYKALAFDLQHDSGAFGLTNGSTSLLGIDGSVAQAVAATTVAFMGSVRGTLIHSNGTITTGNVYEAVYTGSGGTAITTLRMYAITVNSFPTAVTNIRGIEIPNLGDASVSNIAAAVVIAAQSGAVVGNFGIRNSSNLVQVQYARFGSLTVPNNTTDGDLTCVRFTTSNSTFGTSGEFIRCSNTLTTTAAGVDAFYSFQGTVNSATASSTEFRSLSMITLNTASNTTNIITAIHVQGIHRSASAVTLMRGVSIIAVDADSSSPAVTGTVATAVGLRIQTFDGDATNTLTVTSMHAIQIATDASTGAANVSIGTWRGLYIQDRPSGVVLTTQIAIDIEAQTRGTTNIGLRNAATTVETPSAAQVITAAATTLLANATVIQISADNSYTLSTTPTIANGQDGQRVTIMNIDTTDVITLQDETANAGSNLRLAGAANLALGPRDAVTLMYNTSLGDWIEISRSNN